MAKKGNIISVNKLESVMRMDTTTIPMPGVEGVDIVVRHRLPLIEMMMFVDSIVTACVDDETGEYHPELFELASKECVLTMYANFRLPKDIEKMYDLLYNTDMVELVLDHVDEEQYRDIRVSAQKQIRHKLKVLESTAATRVNELVSYVQETIEKINEMADKTNKLYGGMDPDTVGGVMKALSEMRDIDEQKIVHAVLDAQKGSGEPETKVISFPKKEE